MKIDRLISIIMVLLERKKISAKELAEMFEVSLRTIYRDVETINIAGIPIASTPGVNGGFRIMDEYKVDKKIFTASDITTLLMALGSMSSMMSSVEIIGTLAKVKSLIPAEKASEIELKSNQIMIDLKPWMGNEHLPALLETIKTAMQKQMHLSFQYSDRNNHTSHRKIEAYKLMLKDNHWYLQGFCLDRQDFRLFKLSRMSELEMLKETFVLRELPPIVSKFTHQMADKQTSITLRIHESIKDKVLDYCSNEHMEPFGNEQFLVRFPFIADDFGYNLLFSFGDKCECLEPPEVRTEMIRKIENLSMLYEHHKV